MDIQTYNEESKDRMDSKMKIMSLKKLCLGKCSDNM